MNGRWRKEEKKTFAREIYLVSAAAHIGDAYGALVMPTRNVIPNKKNIQISAQPDLNNTSVRFSTVKRKKIWREKNWHQTVDAALAFIPSRLESGGRETNRRQHDYGKCSSTE